MAQPEAAAVPIPAGYTIGPDDVLSVVFWHDKDLSADVVVRPDGKISLPLINDIRAEGLTPEELGASVAKAAAKYIQDDPNVTVVVKQINSRKVYVTGQVGKSGTYPLATHMTVVQLIAMAGGLLEYADKENIIVLRVENGLTMSYRVNYDQVTKPKPKNMSATSHSITELTQNIELKPGDTVIVR